MNTSANLIDFETVNNSDWKYSVDHWDYDVAYLGNAIKRLSTLDPKYAAYADKYINRFVDSDGSIVNYDKEEYNIDNVNPGKNLFALYEETGGEKYKIAMDSLIEQMKTHPKTNAGGFWHKNIYHSPPNPLSLSKYHRSKYGAIVSCKWRKKRTEMGRSWDGQILNILG